MPDVSPTWPQVTPSDLPAILALELKAGNIPFLHGSPSTAKSAQGRAFAKEYNLKYLDIRMSQIQAEDLLGFPRINKDGPRPISEHVPFDFLPLEHTPIPEGYTGWVIGWDEANACKDDSVQAAMYKIWHEREVGVYNLHPNCMQMAMGNLVTDGAIAADLGSASATRVSHYVVKKCQASLLNYARSEQWDSRITSYLEWRPANANAFDPETFEGQMTFACNRQWENLNKVLKVDPKLPESPLALPMVISKLDEGVGRDFLAYCRYFEQLPKLKDVIAAPDHCIVPNEPGIQFATAASLAEAWTPTNSSAISTYMKRLGVEYQVVWFKELFHRNKSAASEPTLQPWKTKFAKDLFA
jgi:hypothetical protein